MNIQHLEAVADTVEQVIQVRVGERVPDWVVRRADQIDFVDASPGQLRHRLQQGEIYPAGQVPQALTHFFRANNLTALRELAQRFLANEPAEDFARLLAHFASRRQDDTAERVLLGVIPAPGAGAMVRRTARMAARIGAKLEVVHVASADDGRLPKANRSATSSSALASAAAGTRRRAAARSWEGSRGLPARPA